ncbi:hypothetical protein E2562_020533 [Oryza meyeriana var. granulata]|uniref:Uncharacterized protein n=1 Tax=Oryza meyeriana var. granulata TaxID=110450 RepID=A0A6G1E9Y2_9ORYZ|nr:hypothetical protein E2562_020533 [Oryza meyeriana var. granulata]
MRPKRRHDDGQVPPDLGHVVVRTKTAGTHVTTASSVLLHQCSDGKDGDAWWGCRRSNSSGVEGVDLGRVLSSSHHLLIMPRHAVAGRACRPQGACLRLSLLFLPWRGH